MIKLGIIGKGNVSELEFQTIISNLNFKLCSGYHTYDTFNVTKFEHFNDFLNSIDAVLIFDIAHSDFYTIKQVLKQSKHMFLSNPVLLDTIEIKKLEQIRLEAGVELHLGMKHRYHNINKEIENGNIKPRLIELNRLHKFNSNFHNNSLINDILFADIDMLLKVVKSDVKSINATGVGVIYNDPDIVNARIEFNNGCIANISSSKIASKEVHKIRFYQNNSFCSADFIDFKFKKLKNKSVNASNLKDVLESSEVFETNCDFQTDLDLFHLQIETFHSSIVNQNLKFSTLNDWLAIKFVSEKICDQLEKNFIVK